MFDARCESNCRAVVRMMKGASGDMVYRDGFTLGEF